MTNANANAKWYDAHGNVAPAPKPVCGDCTAWQGVVFAHYGECAKKPGVDYLHENHKPCQQFKPFE